MSVYLLVSGDFTTWGGMDRANYELAWYLADQAGAEVHLVSHFVAPPLSGHHSVTWHRVPKPLNADVLSEPRLDRQGRRVAESLRAKKPRVIVNGGNCRWGDVNWVHYVHAAYAPSVAQGALRRWKANWGHRRFLAAEQRALRAARVIISNSARTRDDLIAHLALPVARIHPVYYGINEAEFRPATPADRSETRRGLGWEDQRLTAVFVGALGDRRKGFDLAFAAWTNLVRAADWDVDLVAIGAGAELDYWRGRVAVEGLDQRIRLMGFTRDIAPVIAAADLLISPTRYEAYGLGVHEALCCGLPAFVTRSAGIAERYPPELEDWLLDDPPTAADLTDRLRFWRRDVGGYRRRAEEFGVVLRRRSWADMAREMVGLMEADPTV